ncbi:MAG: hypothetical protein ACK4I8_06335 [Armatimonadota bacterium]
MRRKRTLWLTILATFAALVLFVYVASISHPCQQRLKRIAAVLNEIWSDQNLIAQLKTPEDYRRILEERIDEPLVCPDTGKPYLFFPREGIVLADAQPHSTSKSWLAIEWRHTEKGEKFRVVTWSPTDVSKSPMPGNCQDAQTKFTRSPNALPKSKPLPSFFRILFEFIQSLTSWINSPFRPSPADCPTNLGNVGMALLMYVQDYDERFPPMKDVAMTQFVLSPYIRNMSIFFCPITKQPYYPNPHLHHKPLPDIYHPAETPSFYEPVIHPDGLRGVAFADSHVKFITPSHWRTIQERFQLPLPP